MPEFNPQSLAAWTGGRWTVAPASPLLGFCVDSRQLKRGDVFVALKTDKRDGHEFLAAAAAAGAGAALVAVPNPAVTLPQLVVSDPLAAFQAIARCHRQAFRGRVIGISGSAGKTSTKDLLALILGGEASGTPNAGPAATRTAPAASGGPNAPASFCGRVLATEGNLNNHLGVPLTLTQIDPQRHDFAVVEAGISAPGEMAPLADMIEPDVAIITLIAPAHTEDLGGLEGVAREKARLPAATKAAGVAVFSRATGDYAAFRDLGVRAMIVERADVLRPAEPPKDTVYFTVTHRAEETAVAVAYGTPPPHVFTFRRVSDGMAQNAVLAICAALWLGAPVELVRARLALWQPARLRGEIRREPGRLFYLDCYNANPSSMADALGVFDAIAPKGEPRLYVIGCMEELGEEAGAYHRSLGESLELRGGDRAYVIGTHAEDIRAGAIGSGVAAERVEVVPAAAAMADTVRNWRGSIFVKGSRKYQLEKILEPAVETNGALVSGSAH